MEAGKINVGGVFNRSNRLKIPHFQRSYVWDVEQWERFLDDMKYASGPLVSPYFLGSIILKQQEVGLGQPDTRTIIDGQQRLTTINLFFKALYEKNGNPDQFFQVFTTFGEEIIINHNYLDKEVFEKIFFNEELTARDKESLIYKCYKFFLDNIEPNEIDPNRLLANILFVHIDLGYGEDEQQIFDTINSLGVRLTTAELLKNYLFRENDIDSFNNNWRDVFEKDDDIKSYWDQEVTSGRAKRTNIDLFLQAYLFIKIQEPGINVRTDDKLRYFRVDSIFNSYKEFINNYQIDKAVIIQELKEFAQIYYDSIRPNIEEEEIDSGNYLQRLNLIMFGLDTTTIIPFVLYVCKNVQDQEERNKLFNYLESYLMRRIVCRITTKNYNQLFSASMINNEVNSYERLRNTIEGLTDRNNYMPTDEDVKRGFKESWLTNKQSRGVLYLIEKTIRDDNLYTTELKGMKEYTVEHVMPKKWRNHWNEVELTPEQAQERDSILFTLGNLTLITNPLNIMIRDSAWGRKKTGTNNIKGLVEYAQGIKIFSEYLVRDSWGEEDIQERGEKLAQYAVEDVWNLD